MCLPAVVLVLGVAVGTVQVATQQLRVQDAAAVAARQIARGESGAAALTAARLAPGAALAVEHRSGLVCVRLSAAARVAATRIDLLTLRAQSCAPKASS